MTVDNGGRVELGTVLAKAGEGSVCEVVGRPDLVAKVFHRTLSGLEDKLDKVAAMVASPPQGAVQADGFVVLTWPKQLIFEDGQPVGYVMRRIDTTTAVEIHTVSNPATRANPLPGAPRWTANATWAHLVNVAANLCLAVQVVHRVDAVVGDFQERNILVSNTTRVSLVDCDSMQFTDAGGRQYLCGVGRPEFTAPELAAVNLRTHPREKPSDFFALAVHIYQLLMAGNHPFMRGEWAGGGEQPDALSLAKAGHWAGGAGSPLHTHPLAPPPSFLPAQIQALFTRAFTDGVRDPAARPSAAEWRKALLEVQVRPCPRGAHQIPVASQICPWCAIEAERVRRKQNAARNSSIGPQVISHIPDGPHAAPVSVPLRPPPPAAGVGNNSARLAIIGGAVFAMLLVAVLIWAVTSSTQSNNASGGYTTSAEPTNMTSTWLPTVPAESTPTLSLTTTVPQDPTQQLQRIAADDRPFVTAQVADRWVPQLSSKRPGVVDNGVVWDNAMTLQEHQQLRQRYSGVRLLWSGDWSTFSAPDFWVTIVGITFPDSSGPLSWCRSNGFDRDHCAAKIVSTTHPVDGSTAYN